MSIQLEVWGDYALFSRIEFKTERVSYDVMTPPPPGGWWRQSTGILG